MTDKEFDVLDELYFVSSFEELQETTGYEGEELKETLNQLLQKGWIKCMQSRSEDLEDSKATFDQDLTSLFYLATKAGLLAHNSK